MVARCERKRVVAKIRSKGRKFLVTVDGLESKNALGEIRGATEVIRNEAHVPQLFELNHQSTFSRISAVRPDFIPISKHIRSTPDSEKSAIRPPPLIDHFLHGGRRQRHANTGRPFG